MQVRHAAVNLFGQSSQYGMVNNVANVRVDHELGVDHVDGPRRWVRNQFAQDKSREGGVHNDEAGEYPFEIVVELEQIEQYSRVLTLEVNKLNGALPSIDTSVELIQFDVDDVRI